MTHRLSRLVVWTLILTVLVLAATGCTPSATAPTATAPPAGNRQPSTVAVSRPRDDPALSAAVRFEQRHCAWTWRAPLSAYLATQQPLATPAYSKQLVAETDPQAWRQEVVAGQQTVTCTVSEAHRLLGAPSTSTIVYTRMSVSEQISSRLGNFSGGERIVSWLVQRVPAGNGGGQWLVAGSYSGG